MNKRLPTIIWTTIFVVAIDQATKYLAWLTLRGEPVTTYLDGVIRLSFHENPGAFLSMGANWPPVVRTLIFVGLTALFLLYLFYFLLTEEGMSKLGLICGAMMFSGGLGNLIDRIFFENGVIDFLNIGWGSIRTGIFNVADMAIMVGVVGLLFFGRESTADSVDVENPTEIKSEEIEENVEYDSAD